MRTCFYIDGFNLYYGSLKNSSYKWLDVKALSQNILSSENDIVKIKLFTARVKPTKTDQTAHLRQNAYLRALKATIPELEIIFGHFLQHPVHMPLANDRGKVIYTNDKPEFVRVCKREEKGSDVNLAVHLLNDAWSNEYDCGVVISNDSDLAEAMRLVKEQDGKVIGVISPYSKVSKELTQQSHFQRTIPKVVLENSQLPITIEGTKLRKPDTW